MKPKEFDELVRQKFDQNDFAYNPKNWDKLAEQLDGRAKKRSMIMWLWMPAAGMAASVALAIGVTTLLRFGAPASQGNEGSYTQTSEFVRQQPSHEAIAMVAQEPAQAIPVSHSTNVVPYKHKQTTKPVLKSNPTTFGISLNNALSTPKVQPHGSADVVSLVAVPHNATAQPVKPVPAKPKAEIEKPGYNTFKRETVAMTTPPKFSIILSGGINQGNHTSGYMAGATVRRMLNDKVYVEGDVFFASSDNTQKTQYMSYDNVSGGGGLPGSAAKTGAAAKMAKVESGKPTTVAAPEGVIKTQDVSYNLYYAQVTPSIGYKVMKRMSVGLGPDFQKMLVDNRPAVSTVDRGTIQVAPLFDVGFMGKTEYALTNKVKAAVSYRKGVNSIISMTGKYLDRDYLQFQVKCTIFNK